ncbi:hypothetical protein SELMODRAFT_430700 [Selaginella moellendorffii]|uniref:IC97/Casc1 N-terminal domain-containing protein n=2 Tax=Selaginella moellendorffii TaxID=88036 RepID=D8TA76_SELML|nr:hypothetical protein SELMODRAFT_430700 [Selaginella moellendorffii]
MAPKADKKLSKKELKALKKKEKERKKEEARKAAEEKLRLEEEERQRIAEEARLAWEAEQARLKAEHDRIVGEWESLEPVLKRRREGLAKHEARYNGAAEWKRYVEPGPLPYAGNDPSMNGYLNVMAEGYDKDINDVMRTLTDIYSVRYLRASCDKHDTAFLSKIFAGAEELALVEEQKGRPQLVEKYHDYMRRLEELANRRLNHNTAYLLEKSHDYYKRTNECSLFSGQAGWKLALWANHAKNPRARNLDFPAINLFVEVPKPFVFAHVGVRMYHQVTDPLYKSKDIYRTLGGAFRFEIVQLPPLSKTVKEWTFERVTPLTAATIPVEYPFVGVPLGPGNVIPPIIVAYTLPEFVIHFDPVPKVGCWFAEEQCWKFENITDVVYEPETRKLTFHTIIIRPHAMLQNRVRQFPHTKWSINPISESEAFLTLHAASLMLKFEVGDGWCKLVEPHFPECKHLYDQKLAPRVLLKRLSKCGIHLLPDEDDFRHVKTTVKDPEVEMYACRDLAMAAPAAAFASSKWNAHADAQTCVFRFLEIPEPKYPPTFDKSKNVLHVLYKQKGNALLNLTEFKSPEYKEEFTTEYHASLLVTLRSKFSDESIEKMEQGCPGYTETLKDLAYALKLFSAGEPLPPPPPPPEPEVVPAPEASTSEAQPGEGTAQDGEAAPPATGEAPASPVASPVAAEAPASPTPAPSG